jgi:nicotinic acid phosphoribosyltransferase
VQGDGINVVTIGKILDAAVAAGFSAENVAFGMGGGLLQRVNRCGRMPGVVVIAWRRSSGAFSVF